MYLKSLEVLNFKSFKGEVTVPLDRGFTAITGPNGSGKSNCGDAIQFVLGPKSNRVIRPKLCGFNLQRRKELQTCPGVFRHACLCQSCDEQWPSSFASR